MFCFLLPFGVHVCFVVIKVPFLYIAFASLPCFPATGSSTELCLLDKDDITCAEELRGEHQQLVPVNTVEIRITHRKSTPLDPPHPGHHPFQLVPSDKNASKCCVSFDATSTPSTAGSEQDLPLLSLASVKAARGDAGGCGEIKRQTWGMTDADGRRKKSPWAPYPLSSAVVADYGV
ncbi:uncharacterized protein LOC144063165 [Vanacampus margaritifer]